MKQDIFQQFETLLKHDIASHVWIVRTKARLTAYMGSYRRSPLKRLFWRAVPAFMIVVTICLSATGVTLASQESIPGDFLYPWKMGFENVESAFVVGIQSRAVFEVHRTATRLKEVTELAVRKPNDVKITTDAHKRLQEQVEVANAEIAKAAIDDPQQALATAMQLNSALQAHKDVLDKLSPKVDTDSQSQIQTALDAIQKNTQNIATNIENLKTQTKEELVKSTATDGLKGDASQKLNNAKEKLDTAWKDVMILEGGTPLREEAEIKISSAQDALSDAQDAFDQGAFADTIISAQTGEQIISDTIALIEATQNAGTAVKDILVVVPTQTPEWNVTTAVSLNKNDYAPSETMVITLKAVNTSSEERILKWDNGCQVDAVIDGYPSTYGRACTSGMTSVTIKPKETYTWAWTLIAPSAFGSHVINTELVGYEKNNIKFNVALPK